MNTGENDQGLRGIVDFVRMGSIIFLCLHVYVHCYACFVELGFTAALVERVLKNMAALKVISHPFYSKVFVLGLLAISLVAIRGKKDEKLKTATIIALLVSGMLLFFGSTLLFYITIPPYPLTVAYASITTTGFILIMTGGARLSRLIKVKLGKDIFNELNETFPQEERLMTNEYSINLPGIYNLKGKMRRMWINVINPFRGILVIGSPGAGKSYFVVRHVIAQHLQKGFSMFVYDFKFDDLSIIAYNHFINNLDKYKNKPSFYVINFDKLSHTHRCNPIDPSTMFDITDAAESARTIMLGLNREWVKKQGDFFVESPINFVTAIIWYLRKYKDGKYCTLPHVIELMQSHYDDLFPIISSEPECEVYLNPFINAYLNRAMEQLEGQVASAKIGMARLSSPQLYYVMSGNDFTLDINDPEQPKVVCMGNNPQKVQVYGAVLSLYVTRLLKLVNQKNKLKSSLIFDEFPTIYIGGTSGVQSHIATSRSNLSSTLLAVQDLSQVRMDYGKEQADVIMNIVGNIVSGQVTGDTAKQLSERFGKILQEKESLSINRSDTSVSKSTQLDYAIPQSKIAALSSGEFVGMVADNPTEIIKLKTFHAHIQNDHEGLKAEEAAFKPIPKIRDVSPLEVQNNFIRIKNEVVQLIQSEIERIKNDPNLAHLIFVKEDGK